MTKIFNKIRQHVFPVSQKKIIKAIHDDFDSAGERLLAEAKQILAKETDTSRADRLRKIGFHSMKEVLKSSQIIRAQSEKRELASLIEGYRFRYPFNKFITEDEVKKICLKYGLLCGEVGKYIGDMPEKNLREIESFKLLEEDKCVGSRHRDSYRYRGLNSAFNSMSKRYSPTRQSYFETEPALSAQPDKYTFSLPFQICAPSKDFNMTRMKVSGHFLVKDDPIVLQPVKGGYLIVSKWGLEASDELVQNPASN